MGNLLPTCLAHTSRQILGLVLASEHPSQLLQAESDRYFETTVLVAACQNQDDNPQAGGSKPQYHLP